MEAKGGKGGGGPSFVLPEEDEAATSSRHVVPPVALRSTSPRNITNTANSKAKEGDREDEKHWTLAELKGWAARLDERERAIAEREASLDKRAQWLDQQQARVFRMSVQRYHALQALDDQAVLRMQAIVRAWLRRRQWLKNMIRMKSCDDEAIVKMRRRASALKEIVISEQSYIRSLQVLLMEFLVPIVEGGVLKDDEHMGVSFIIGQVLSVNKQFHVAMQKKYAQWPTKHSFAEVFLEHIPLMKKAYANYIAVFDHITSVLLDHSNKKKSPLSAFLEEKMTKGGLDLKAYLIMPVQRLPRYEILLTELIKNTFPEHSDYEQLQKALAKVKKMNSYVDLKKREIDIKKEFLQIQQRQEKKVDHYIKQGKDMTLTTFSDLRELLTNKKQGDTPDRPRRDKSAAPEKERAFSKTSMLKVCILEGRHLTPTTHDEAPNPYCVVTVGKQSYKSKKKTKTFHPSWSNATFVFDVNDLQGQVEIECWDANNLIKTEMLGRVALNIADVITLRPERGNADAQPLRQSEEDEEGEGTEIRSLEGKPRWCSLMDPEYGRSKTGELRVSFHYMRAEEEVERLRLLADAHRKREDASGEHVTHMVVNKAKHAARRQQHLRQHSTSSGATATTTVNDSSNASDDDTALLSTSSDVYDNQGEEWERPLSRDGSVIVDTNEHHHHSGVDSNKTRKKEKRKSTTLKEMLGEIKKKGNTLHRRTRSVDNKQSSAIDTGDRPEGAAAAAVAREKASESGSRGSGKKEKRKTAANAMPSKMSTSGVVCDDDVSTTPSTSPSPGSASGSSVSSSLPTVVAGGRCSPTTARRIMSSDSVVRGPHMPEHPEEAPEEWELSAQITLGKGRTATASSAGSADDRASVDGEKPAAVNKNKGSGAHKKTAPAPAATASATIAKGVSDSPRSRSPRPSSTYTPASPSSSSASSASGSASFSTVSANSKEERLTLRFDAAKREKQEKEKEKEKAKEKKPAAEDKKERKREDDKNEAKKSDSAAAPVSAAAVAAVQQSPRAQPPPEHRIDQPSPPPPESSSVRDKAKEAKSTETAAVATIATAGLMASGGSGSGGGSSGTVPCSPKGRFLTPEELAEVIREKRAASPRRLDFAAAAAAAKKKKEEEEAEAEAQKEEEEKRRKKNETQVTKNEDEAEDEDEDETDSEDERSLEKARAKARRLRERSFQRDASSSSSDESD